VAAIGEGWCFFTNAVSYIAVIVGLLLMRMPVPTRVQPSMSVVDGIAEGFRFAWHTKPIRALLLLLGLVSLVGMPYAMLMPIFADQVLHGGPKALGLLVSAAGIGALSGALTLAARRGVSGLERWIAFCSACFGACLILFSLSRSFWLSAALLVLIGFSQVGQMASANTLIQVIVPDALRGRMMSVYSIMLIGMAPFGSLLAGAVAHRLGAPATVAISGALCVIAALAFALHLRLLTRGARQMADAVGTAGPG
jgi:predicted MFS family arabinose efflux permease